MTQSVKDEAKFLDTRLDDETAAVLEKWNLVILGAALLHDADHIRQAIRWHYKIPMQQAHVLVPDRCRQRHRHERGVFEGAPVQAYDGHLGRLELQLL